MNSCYIGFMANLIMIEDDSELGELVVSYLAKYNHKVNHFLHPLDALKHLEGNEYDLMILDIMLPDLDGFGVIKKLRKSSDLPVMMLTARGDVQDRIVGLELGADDYLPKPFEPRELLARIETILRRTSGPKPATGQVLKLGDLQVNFDRREAFFEETNLELTTMEFELLSFFIEKRGRALSRDDIMNKLQGIDSNVFSRSIDILVSRLRQKLKDDSKDAKYIKTIWGKGYMFIGGEN
jgi:DNA-binding response OmpR family regulator